MGHSEKTRNSLNGYVMTAAELNAQTKYVEPNVKSRSRSVTADGSGMAHHDG